MIITRWIFAMLLCLAAVPPSKAQGGIVRIEPVPANEASEAQNAGLFAEQDFVADPASPSVIGNGTWRLQPVAGLEQPLLLVYHPYSARVRVEGAGVAAPMQQTLFDRHLDPQYSRHALVFPLSGSGEVRMTVEGARYPLQVSVLPRATHIARDLTQVRVLLLSIGVLVGVSLTVLLFWAVLRERIYLLYAASMALQMLFLLCSYGEAYAVPVLRGLSAWGVQGIWFIATVSTMAAVYMLLDYADLRTRVPRLGAGMRWLGVYLPALLLLFLALPWPADKRWFPNLGNLLFLLTNLLAIVALLVAWRRGGRHAGFVLIAWVPLVAFSTARAVQLSMGIPVESWLQYGLPLVLAFSAVVLALGLADRMLTFRQERDTAKEHAERDWLTGVMNRAGIAHRLAWAVLERRRDGTPLSLLFIDLDDFKQVNDKHGHAVGDGCLRAVVRVVTEELHYGDQLGRLGGDEFVLGLPAMDIDSARQLAERLCRKIESDCREVDGLPVALSVSIGVAECQTTDSVESLVRRADKAMYQAKRAGGNRMASPESEAG
ncbi:MAG: diguanylate cyclase [Lysobacteraceae bacterium]|nr:MAG: diguanylate cyclase [Xanthomonadaceae bacterium]